LIAVKSLGINKNIKGIDIAKYLDYSQMNIFNIKGVKDSFEEEILFVQGK
jgi:hypothetical protein